MRFVLPRDHMRILPHDASPTGFVYFGPKAYVKDRGSFVMIAQPDFPATLDAQVSRHFTSVIGSYTTNLGQALPSKPIVIAQISQNLRGYQGSVSEGFVTHLRFSASGWEKIDLGLSNWLKGFIAHEVFHFWNGGLVSSSGEGTWLHEGSAEYAAIVTTHGDNPQDRQALNREIASNLARCQSALIRQGHPALDRLPFVDNSIRYPCGAIMMWAADLRARKLSNGTRTFFDVWRDIVARALARPDRQYRIADFTELVDPQSGHQVEAIRLLREGSGAQRFADVVSALRADGARIDQSMTADTMRAGVIRHVIVRNCRLEPGKPYGYGVNGRVVTLDTYEGCGVLAGSPIVAAIEGIDPLALSGVNYASFQRKCAISEPLAFTMGNGHVVNVPCPAPLPDAELAYSVGG
jgi:hypothetical protein